MFVVLLRSCYKYCVPMTQIFNKKHQTPKRKILRRNIPQAEIALWRELKNKKLGGYKFRRQCGIHRYVVDFYCPEVQLVIEVDGAYHDAKETQVYDKQRDELMKSLGINVVRFTNMEILNNINNVLKCIRIFLK